MTTYQTAKRTARRKIRRLSPEEAGDKLASLQVGKRSDLLHEYSRELVGFWGQGFDDVIKRYLYERSQKTA